MYIYNRRNCANLLRTLLLAAGLLLCLAVPARAYDFSGTSPVILARPVTRNPKILLIGNSLTARNDLPKMLKNLCRKSGINARVESVTVGGHALSNYLNPNDKKAEAAAKKIKKLLKSEDWDYVVLQDRSYEAIKHPFSMRASIRKWKKVIEKEGAQMVLVMTWAPAEGHASYQEGIAANRDAYQKKVADTYVSLAKKTGAALAPSGIAFTRGLKCLDVNLYVSDKLHPSKAGSYLSACVIYGTLFGKSPEGIASYVSIAGKSAAKSRKICRQLQSLAADVTVRG